MVFDPFVTEQLLSYTPSTIVSIHKPQFPKVESTTHSENRTKVYVGGFESYTMIYVHNTLSSIYSSTARLYIFDAATPSAATSRPGEMR